MYTPGRPLGGPIDIRECENPSCSNTFKVHTGNKVAVKQRFCCRTCARQADNRARKELNEIQWLCSPESWCPCAEVQIPYDQRALKKFCSQECRNKYGKKRVADSAGQITFICNNPSCAKEVTRPKNYGGRSSVKFCSNLCATKVNKAVHHVIDRESTIVFDGDG